MIEIPTIREIPRSGEITMTQPEWFKLIRAIGAANEDEGKGEKHFDLVVSALAWSAGWIEGQSGNADTFAHSVLKQIGKEKT